jgi:hypothetical protein
VRFLHARAAFRKDVGQHAALGPITSDLDEGIRIARAGLEATQDQDKGQWAGQLAALLQNRIATLLFLQSTDLSAVQPDLELLREAGQAPAYANALCTVAEWQMKQAGLGHADWSAIGNRVHEAYVILKNSGEGRYLNYCYYQYAQFLRKRPHPDPGSASALYQQAEEAAADAGEPRRQALAGYRRIELQWGQLKQLNGAEACRQLERLLALLVAEQTDSLTLRAVERLNSLRAAIGLKEATGPVDGYLLEACRAAARLPAASESDRRRLAVSCRAYLAHKLQQGDYPAARELLEELADTLTARLGIVMDDRDPRRVVENLGQRFGT